MNSLTHTCHTKGYGNMFPANNAAANMMMGAIVMCRIRNPVTPFNGNHHHRERLCSIRQVSRHRQ
jgi:hypothetical protein